MTIAQLARQLNIPSETLEKESLRAFLLSKLGEIEAKRHTIAKKYGIESVRDWDERLERGEKKEGEYEELSDYFLLDQLDFEKERLIKDILSF